MVPRRGSYASVTNKIDIFEIKEAFDSISVAFKEKGVDVYGVSAVTGEGIDELLTVITKELSSIPEMPRFDITEPVKVININDLQNKRLIFRHNLDEKKAIE